MCGMADATVGESTARLKLGYSGGRLNVDNYEYNSSDPDESRNEMYDILMSYSKGDIVDMLLSFVDNADEY